MHKPPPFDPCESQSSFWKFGFQISSVFSYWIRYSFQKLISKCFCEIAGTLTSVRTINANNNTFASRWNTKYYSQFRAMIYFCFFKSLNEPKVVETSDCWLLLYASFHLCYWCVWNPIKLRFVKRSHHWTVIFKKIVVSVWS